MSNIISLIIVAVLGVIGNVAYFEYRLKKEHRKETTREQLINLLLPLYVILKNDELEYHAYDKYGADIYEYFSDRPDRLFKPIKKILDKNLYLADDDLQSKSLLLIEWLYRENSSERFQKLHHEESKDLSRDKILYDFRDVVYKKYNKQRENYLK